MRKIKGMWPVCLWSLVFWFLALSSLWWGCWMLVAAGLFFLVSLEIAAWFLKKRKREQEDIAKVLYVDPYLTDNVWWYKPENDNKQQGGQ